MMARSGLARCLDMNFSPGRGIFYEEALSSFGGRVFIFSIYLHYFNN